MLGKGDVTAHAAVKDIEKAKEFYEGVLGLTPVKEDEGGMLYKSGNTGLYVYQTEYAGTNQATGASWEVDDIEAVVAELKSKGVIFEKYDLPGSTREGEIHIIGKVKAAWFKDPDGNIFAIANEG